MDALYCIGGIIHCGYFYGQNRCCFTLDNPCSLVCLMRDRLRQTLIIVLIARWLHRTLAVLSHFPSSIPYRPEHTRFCLRFIGTYLCCHCISKLFLYFNLVHILCPHCHINFVSIIGTYKTKLHSSSAMMCDM